jgi:hypothetical protein
MLLGSSPTDSYGTVSYSIWGIEEQLRALHAEGNAILVEGFNLDLFGRALAKIAHGFVAGELGLDTFEPYLPDYILGTAPHHGSYFIGKWRDEVEKPRLPGLLHQVGVAVVQYPDRALLEVRIRLFAEHENTPVYRVIAGRLIKDVPSLPAPLSVGENDILRPHQCS